MCWVAVEEVPPHEFADGSHEQRPVEYRIKEQESEAA